MIVHHYSSVVLVLLLRVEWVEHVEQVRVKLSRKIKREKISILVCGLFFAAAGKSLLSSPQSNTLIENISNAFEAGIQSVESYARVQPGDKSLLDVLIPIVDFIKSKCKQQEFQPNDWKELVAVAEQAANDTKNLVAKVGRASYTKSVDTPFVDPGAYAVLVILEAISEVFSATTTTTTH